MSCREQALIALHAIHLALDESASLPAGAVGFPSGQDPFVYTARRIVELANELRAAVARSSEAPR